MSYLRESEFLRSLPFHSLRPALPCEIPSRRLKKPNFFLARNTYKAMVLSSNRRQNTSLSAMASRSTTEDEESSAEESQCRPPFDLNLAVVLAGFAFEAYTTPPKDVGYRELDTAQCQTVFLSNSFLREVYDGQLFIKLRKGVDLPAMDPWGTSDPYVIFQLDGQVAKSNVKWATTDPTWNEDFALNINITTTKNLQIAVWDANLVTEHKCMGNGWVNLESFCDGNLHDVMVELEGIRGGAMIYLEVRYKTYNEIYEEKQWWRLPFVSDFILKSSLGSALRSALGSECLNASQFVQSAFGQLKLFNYNYGKKDSIEAEESLDAVFSSNQTTQQVMFPPSSMLGQRVQEEKPVPLVDDADGSNSLKKQKTTDSQQVEYFWKTFADIINQTIFQNLGVSLPEIKSWEIFDFLNKMGEQLRISAEENYIESELAISDTRDENNVETGLTSTIGTPSSLSDMRKASRDLLSQTETIFGALVVLAITLSQQKNDSTPLNCERNNKDIYYKVGSGNEEGSNNFIKGAALNTKRAEEMRKVFSSAESAMEAWTMLATSLGRTSLIKSEFEKICFLDNVSTDTQVAIWRDSLRRRLVISFRGTEQSKWKDLLTDLMLLPAGLNPERLGVDFKQEVQVHGGFLNAYDSVRNRILMLIKHAIGYTEDNRPDIMQMWSVYVTGHSLGGALATLLALELSTSRMAKHGAISVIMYNFGSPRVGNRRFAEVYNVKVKNSWRVVNHRDIIPTVPRLMGYCHVAQPVYLAAGKLEKALLNQKFGGDGYEVDVIGEATPDVLVNEFMKGEKQLIEKILQTEINLLQSIRDGTALMQHMEDFYYITLLESVRSNYSV